MGRQKRTKTARKVMRLYVQAFHFREPYQLLVDSAFATACVHQKLDFHPRLEDVVQGSIKPMITQCSIQALYDLGAAGAAAVDLAKGWERRKCNHFKARPEPECLLSMAGTDNKHNYVVATQSPDLRKALRAVPGTPLVYLNRSVILLEAPSDATLKKKDQMEKAKLHAPAAELSLLAKAAAPASTSTALIDAPLAGPSTSSSSALPPPSSPALAASAVAADDATPKPKKKRKGPPGPNPLSVKKKQKKKAMPVGGGGGGERDAGERKRPREDGDKGRVESLAKRGGGAPALGGEGGEGRKRKRRRVGKKIGEGGGVAEE